MVPKFSIRQLLWLMVAIGVLSLCMSSAARGNRVAFGISVAVIGAVLPFTGYAIVHWASFAVASLIKLRGDRLVGNESQRTTAIVGVPSESAVPPESDGEVARDEEKGDEHV